MSEDKSRIIERVVTRLTEMRMDLDAEAQSVLDQIVIGEAAEVTGHAFDPGFNVRGRISIDEGKYRFNP